MELIELVARASSITLNLQELEPEDAAAYFALIDKNREHLGDLAEEYPDEASVRRSITPQRHLGFRFGIWKDTNLLGAIDLRERAQYEAEISYWIANAFCRKGFAQAAVRTVTRFALRTRDLNAVYGLVDPENYRSAKVLLNNGFAREPMRSVHGKDLYLKS